MGDNTDISWSDATWNPVTGCDAVSPGCDNCYAESIATRFAGTKAYPNGFKVTLRPDRFDLPLRWTRGRRIFVNSTSDLFHDDVPTEYIAKVFAVMAASPHHTFQVLTKRHARMRSLLSDPGFQGMVAGYVLWVHNLAPNRRYLVGNLGAWPLPNVWVGVSVEDQKWADIRIPALIQTPAVVRFLSCEPLLGPVDLGLFVDHRTHARDTDWTGYGHMCLDCSTDDVEVPWTVPHGLDGRPVPAGENPNLLHWVIAGGESGPAARPMHPDWARSLRDQCQAAGVAFHFKQWGAFTPTDPGTGKSPTLVSAGPTTGGTGTGAAPTVPMWRVGAKVAGNDLDGATWQEFPNAPSFDPPVGVVPPRR